MCLYKYDECTCSGTICIPLFSTLLQCRALFKSKVSIYLWNLLYLFTVQCPLYVGSILVGYFFFCFSPSAYYNSPESMSRSSQDVVCWSLSWKTDHMSPAGCRPPESGRDVLVDHTLWPPVDQIQHQRRWKSTAPAKKVKDRLLWKKKINDKNFWSN